MLGKEYNDFFGSFDCEPLKSFRMNPLKGDINKLINASEWMLKKVPWCDTGYYYESDITPGKHPYHEAGVYYIQEASAMLPATLLDAKPGEKVLDLCAAPGGKSTQIAGAMKGEGMLICNEIIPNRAKILSENIERMGIENAIVTNADSATLAEKFPEYFDRIMVDAPCSGEGMFRKNTDACDEWSPQNVEICADRQLEILENAARMLKSGGHMVYSTCTFAPLENEGTIYQFLKKHPEFSVVSPGIHTEGFDTGHFDWISEENPDISFKDDIENCIRLWPHKIKGEGHFAALLEKSSDHGGIPRIKFEKGISPQELKDYLSFERNYLNIHLHGTFIKFGNQLYLLPKDTPVLKGIKVLRPGLHLGTFLKNRFEPSHALALALKPEDVKLFTDISLEIAKQYISGQTFNGDGEKGWHLILVDGYSLGWGKQAGGIMKNHYPKGLRKY